MTDFAGGLVVLVWLVDATLFAALLGAVLTAFLVVQGGSDRREALRNGLLLLDGFNRFKERQERAMADLKEVVDGLVTNAAENKTAIETLTAKVDAALQQLAAARASAVDPATVATLDGVIATLSTGTSEANAESAKVDVVLSPAPAAEPAPAPTEPAA